MMLDLRLCRLMCGRSPTFREASLFFPWGYAGLTEGRRPSAHQAAQPRRLNEKPLIVTFASAVRAGRAGGRRLLRDSPRGLDSRLRCFMDWRAARSGDVLSHHRSRDLDLVGEKV